MGVAPINKMFDCKHVLEPVGILAYYYIMNQCMYSAGYVRCLQFLSIRLYFYVISMIFCMIFSQMPTDCIYLYGVTCNEL